MTDEGKTDTEKWIERTSASYPYAYDTGGKLAREFGVSGIPHSVLINPAGQIVWRGHPMSLEASMLTKHLAGALEQPLWEWPKSMASVKKCLLKQHYAKALAAASKLAQEDQSLAKFEDAVRSIIKGRVTALSISFDSGDYLGAQQQGLILKKQLKGLPEAETVDATLTSISKDKQAKAVIKAQKSLAKLKRERIRKKKDAKKVILRAKKLVAKLPGTYVETQANEFVAKLQELARSLR